jgi:hypothetical protein
MLTTDHITLFMLIIKDVQKLALLDYMDFGLSHIQLTISSLGL